MVKDAAESGGRGAQAFSLHQADGRLDLIQMDRAVDFIYQLSLKHNVSIQEAIISSPEYWATEAFMRRFMHHQIIDWASPVNRRREPYTQIFGSIRLILSKDKATECDVQQNWHISHWITLNSKQLITNIGRGGVLHLLQPEIVIEEYRKRIFTRLTQAGQQVMLALNAYETQAAKAYKQATGLEIGCDLLQVSYGHARYMMLDFLITPIFAEPGRLIAFRREYRPETQASKPYFTLEHEGQHFQGTVIDWRVILIEPNVGVGLWDRVALREEQAELELAKCEQRSVNWSAVGFNARIVLKDLHYAGEAYLTALKQLADDSFYE